MKHILTIFFGILLVAVACWWGFWAYRQYTSYDTLIPRNANLVVRVNVDALLKDIAWNAFWNRDYYAGVHDDTQPKFNRTKLKQLGITIPANAFLYRLDGIESCYFGTLNVEDVHAAQRMLTQEFGMYSAAHETATFLHSKYLMATLAENRIAFAIPAIPNISLDTPEVVNVLQGLVRGVHMAPVSESDFKTLRSMKGHFAFTSKGVSGTVHCKDGHMLLTAQVQAMFSAPVQPRPDFPITNTASLWLNADLKGLLRQRVFRVGAYNLIGDSLLNYYQDGLSLEWRGSTMQQDTAITYDYNDDFELVEQVELIDKKVPELHLAIRSDAAGLTNYLRTQGFLKTGGTRLNPDVFPLYQVNVSQTGPQTLQFHTTPTPAYFVVSAQSADERCYIHIDFMKIAEQGISPLLTTSTLPFKRLEAIGHATSSEQLTIQSLLSMRNPRINSLVQLMSMYSP